MMIKAVFRTDASLQIGTGHVIRCLTLADGFRNKGVECIFVCRALDGNLVRLVEERGFKTYELPNVSPSPKSLGANGGSHADWLGTSWQIDLEQSIRILASINAEFLVVDHYSLDIRWEMLARPYVNKLIVIDDLFDRKHDCDFLIDANLGSSPDNYKALVPQECTHFIGPKYALLRREFREMRDYSLKRRSNFELVNVLISMGGVDQANATAKILTALTLFEFPSDLKVTVILGEQSPWRSSIQYMAKKLPFPTSVIVNTSNMARLMSECDLAIGAGGGTSWERCCLGVPTLLCVLAENQRGVADKLESIGSVQVIRDIGIASEKISDFFSHPNKSAVLEGMSRKSAEITDGLGTERILEVLLG